jgi:ERCC4-type nuclease
MLDKYKYTDKEQKELLASMKLLIDTREQKGDHIINWLDQKKIAYKKQKLNQGDYSFYVPKNPVLNIDRDLHFDNEICIERKNSIDELIGNFASDRTRIESEFLRHKGKMILLVEDSSYGDIINGNYRSKYSIQSAIGTLHAFSARYNIPFIFIDSKYSGHFIYYTLSYYLREIIK